MAQRAEKMRRWAGGAAVAAGAAALLAVLGAGRGEAVSRGEERAQLGEARQGRVTIALDKPVPAVIVSRARVPGRPIVVIDPGHGGRDPGATSASGDVTEKALTLALARELRDLLVDRGRVRVAMTRDSDAFLTLDQRAAIARRVGAGLFLSIHMDSAPNPLARGASVYSLADVASDEAAARFAASENEKAGVGAGGGGSVEAMLLDLGERLQMSASADLAERLVRKTSGRIGLRPQPHRFASFHVLRRAAAPAVLFEAGYVSNSEDERLLRSPEYRRKMALALAQAVETDLATRNRR